jgi:hypothetical protein
MEEAMRRCLAPVRIFLEVGRIPLRIPKEIRPHSRLQMLASSLDRLAKHEQTAGAPEFKFTGLSSALPTVFPRTTTHERGDL